MVNFVLFELASGYALFEHVEVEEIGQELDQVQQAIQNLDKFGRMIKLKAFSPFKSAAEALQNCNDISEGICNESLKCFLESGLPKGKSSTKCTLGVAEKTLAAAIKAECGLSCVCNDITHELIRGIRFHLEKMMKQLSGGNLEKTQLGLGHSYSRAKVKFNVNRSDTMITQAICMLDQLDKDINTFAMRIREWYGWHFPELVKIVNENKAYALLAQFIKDKARLGDSDLEQLEVITGDPGKAKQILDASRSSMGTDISEVDMINIGVFASRVLSLVEYRQELQQYLHSKMHHVAPNLSALIGDTVGARLISHAGSLTSLAKYPASTVQILGAEKALFRALKTRGNTPKYGLIYHSSFIGRAGAKNKGRISRYLANKCTIASRIDCFTDTPTTKFGEAMKRQVEDRLNFYETGKSTTKNADVMQSVILELQGGDLADPLVAESSKKRKKADGNEKTKKSKKTKKESK